MERRITKKDIKDKGVYLLNITKDIKIKFNDPFLIKEKIFNNVFRIKYNRYNNKYYLYIGGTYAEYIEGENIKSIWEVF